MKGLAGQRARNGAIGTDQPQIEPKLLCDGERECVTSARHENDFDPLRVSRAQRRQVSVGNLKFRIQQSAIDINGNQADGIGGHK